MAFFVGKPNKHLQSTTRAAWMFSHGECPDVNEAHDGGSFALAKLIYLLKFRYFFQRSMSEKSIIDQCSEHGVWIGILS